MPHRFPWPLFAWWLVLGSCVIVIRLLSDGVVDMGDGIAHFQIAHHAPRHPQLFLDAWGKPLFTLLSAPLAQLGPWGMTLFNALCFIGTAWAADGVLRHAGPAVRWLFAPAMLLMPAYGIEVLAGMTEPLFACLAVVVIRLLWDERFVAAAIIASFLPFTRPEWIGVMPFIVGWLLWHRQGRALPWLLTASVVHATGSAIILGEPFLMFRSAYGDASAIYGRGYLAHFIDRMDLVLGPGPEWLLILAMPAGIAIAWLRQDERPRMMQVYWSMLLPFLTVVAVHSVLWWQGWRASLGLTRVLVTVAPLALLFTAYVLGRAGLLIASKAPPALSSLWTTAWI